MANITTSQAKAQYDRIVKDGWLAYFKDSAAFYGLPVEILIAIGSRETNLINEIGDNGRGFSLMQIDIGSFPKWCESGVWRQVDQAIAKGASVLTDKIKAVMGLQGKRIICRHGEFIADSNIPDTDVMKIAIAAYNCGEANALYGYSKSAIDMLTTGHDYSGDVLDRAAMFKAFITGGSSSGQQSVPATGNDAGDAPSPGGDTPGV